MDGVGLLDNNFWIIRNGWFALMDSVGFLTAEMDQAEISLLTAGRLDGVWITDSLGLLMITSQQASRNA